MDLPEFRNEPYTDFAQPENARAYREALARVRGTLGRTYPLVIGSERVQTPETIESLNPCRPSELVGRTASATSEHADLALAEAWRAFEAWRATPVEERVRVALRAARILRERKLDFDALLTLEVGKNYLEAEAETAEAVDFLEYYARQAIRYARPVQTVQLSGERDHAEYVPLGAGVSISPWNFPLAIFLGQTIGPVLAGNTMIAKPAEDAGVVAAWTVDVLLEAGLPPGVVNFLPGRGEEVGAQLVKHPRTRFINFTGSKSVGLWINAEAAVVRPGQRWIKRVSLELGGKDAMIVDETADLDAAADAAVAAAFGYAGQKCSALSRLIVVEPVYRTLVDKVAERAARLTVGPAEENANVPALINADSLRKTSEYLELARTEGRVVLGGERGDGDGYYVRPTVVADVAPRARLAQEEIFGPVLSVIPVRDFEEAMSVANDTEYGLTGGLFSSDEKRLERAEDEIDVGNLYLNRKITGAMVGVHPFGGFNLSGTDSKGGGPDYLGLFLQMKSIARRV